VFPIVSGFCSVGGTRINFALLMRFEIRLDRLLYRDMPHLCPTIHFVPNPTSTDRHRINKNGMNRVCNFKWILLFRGWHTDIFCSSSAIQMRPGQSSLLGHAASFSHASLRSKSHHCRMSRHPRTEMIFLVPIFTWILFRGWHTDNLCSLNHIQISHGQSSLSDHSASFSHATLCSNTNRCQMPHVIREMKQFVLAIFQWILGPWVAHGYLWQFEPHPNGAWICPVMVHLFPTGHDVPTPTTAKCPRHEKDISSQHTH
jgi:hypothetical protein